MAILSCESDRSFQANGMPSVLASSFVVLTTSAYSFRLLYHLPWSSPQSLKVSQLVSGEIGYSSTPPMAVVVGKRISRRRPRQSAKSIPTLGDGGEGWLGAG